MTQSIRKSLNIKIEYLFMNTVLSRKINVLSTSYAVAHIQLPRPGISPFCQLKTDVNSTLSYFIFAVTIIGSNEM